VRTFWIAKFGQITPDSEWTIVELWKFSRRSTRDYEVTINKRRLYRTLYAITARAAARLAKKLPVIDMH